MDNAAISFRKMNGLGNDFVVLDGRDGDLRLNTEMVAAIADRNSGIGCDQLIVLEPSNRADLFMRIYNADGSEVAACGNATRCVAAIAAVEAGKLDVTIETEAGLLAAKVGADGMVSVDMGEPRLAWDQIPLAEPFHDTKRIELQLGPIDDPVLHSPAVANIGNPHCIFFVEDAAAHDLSRFGPMVENYPLFPERANVSLAEVIGPDALKLITWERGAGLTKACGTAACAAAVSAVRRKLTGRKVTVSLPGGDLVIEWREADNHILMTGPYALDYEGVLPDELVKAKASA
ncbi:diaminopimelate epimerase [Methyloligella sp. 2.7D]|uniref:diaminopimelate epimerase n=1 Tax=unclassified Methyloligella TaxID=2625955 RepID=UPI00157BC567|nr:diaminopimelate epimerase [Methyloligella sp. GL2]QKP76422.1 diaminopimelate epimerase [Methyloligella sp. GL2]